MYQVIAFVCVSFFFVGCSTASVGHKSRQKRNKAVAPPPVLPKKGCSLSGRYLAQKSKNLGHTNYMFLNSDEYLAQPISLAKIVIGEADSDEGVNRSVQFVPECHAYSKVGNKCKAAPSNFIDPWLEQSFFLTRYDARDYDSAILPASYNGRAIVDEIFEMDGETHRIFAVFPKVAKDCSAFTKLIVALQPCGDCSDIAMSGRIEILTHFPPAKAKTPVVFRR